MPRPYYRRNIHYHWAEYCGLLGVFACARVHAARKCRTISENNVNEGHANTLLFFIHIASRSQRALPDTTIL